MVITQTPLRISFLGGGTDYPDHFRHHGGQTLGVAINKFSYVTISRLPPLFDHTIAVSYSRTELATQPDEIQHPAVRECLRYLSVESNVDIHYIGDLPARSGMGSSSSFTVGLLHALHAMNGQRVSDIRLAEEAVFVEQQMICERVGVQDQYICAHGGLVHLKISRNGNIRVIPICLAENRLVELQSHMMLFYTGIRRHAHEVLDEQIDRTKNGSIEQSLCHLGSLVDQGLEILTGQQDLAQFGELLHTAWLTKQQLSSKISNAQINQWYDSARQAGAVGGKLLGAGGGGFLLFFVKPEKQFAVQQALRELRQVPFNFENSGSSVIFYRPEQTDFPSFKTETKFRQVAK